MSGHMWLLQLRGTNIFHGLPRHPQHPAMTKYDFKKKKKQRKKAEKNRGSTEDQKRSRSKKRKNDSKRTVQASQKIKELQTSHGSFYLIGPCPREFYHIQSRAHLIWLSKLTSSILEVVDHSPCYSFRRNRWPTRAL